MQNSSFKPLICAATQFFIGAICSYLAFRLYVWSIGKTLPVESVLELVQEALLLLTVFVIWQTSRRLPQYRGGLLLVVGFFMALFIRELDAWFDIIVHGFWKYVLLAYLAILGVRVYQAGLKTVIPGITHLIQSRAFPVMLVGVVMILVYSRLFGFKGLWEAMAGADCLHWRSVKTFSEESSELLSYSILFTSVLYYWAGVLGELKRKH